MKTNPMRLLILAVLQNGPHHGHQIKRMAEIGNLEEWAGINVGSLYGMISRLEREGLIDALRTERQGRRPPRTVYEITHEGRIELSAQREAALTDMDLRATAVDLAITFAAGDDEDDLREVLEVRRKRIAAMHDELRSHRRRDERAGFLPPSGSIVFRHWELRLEAELRWHEELDAQLGQIAGWKGYPDATVDKADVVELHNDKRRKKQ